MAPCLAVLGTGSDVGKSIINTALCRIFQQKGISVAPFKAQNMSNNSGVTPEGLEIGRAQIVQAEACALAPHVDMNPILLKPTSEIGSQVVLLGSVSENTTAMDYHQKKDRLFKTATDSLDRLRRSHELIIMEGAGSCAEVNLMDNDIVNLRMAEYAKAPVIVVADIHRGGVFAQIVGTLECLQPAQRNLIKGFIINRFRGDIKLFENGARWIEEKTGKRIFGVLPWYDHILIEPEDSVVIESPRKVFVGNHQHPAVAVIRLPHISNFNDFDPLTALKELDVFFLEKAQDLDPFQAVILPGSKNTRFDLDWVKTSGWAEKIAAYAAQGGHVIGICGGYQMMGDVVHDPGGLEGKPGTTAGLRLLPVETELKAPKTTTLTRFTWGGHAGLGYEIHMGQTNRKQGQFLFEVFERNGTPQNHQDGCRSDDTRVLGTYIHGLFENPPILRQWLDSIGLTAVEIPQTGGVEARNNEYDKLAEHFVRYVDMESIADLIGV